MYKKENASTVYAYQANCDGEWGKIQFNFETGSAEIVRLAEWDTTNSHVFATYTIRHILALLERRLTANALVAFEVWQMSASWRYENQEAEIKYKFEKQ